jgi:hypothetical protein
MNEKPPGENFFSLLKVIFGTGSEDRVNAIEKFWETSRTKSIFIVLFLELVFLGSDFQNIADVGLKGIVLKQEVFSFAVLILNSLLLFASTKKIERIGYVSNLALIRPNGFSTLIISMYAEHESGNVIMKQPDELVDYAWVSLTEAKKYDLIENIYEQIVKVDGIFSKALQSSTIVQSSF